MEYADNGKKFENYIRKSENFLHFTGDLQKRVREAKRNGVFLPESLVITQKQLQLDDC